MTGTEPDEGEDVISKLTALATTLAGLWLLVAGVHSYMNPERMVALGNEPEVWMKAVVTGLCVMVIGMVAMAGTRRLG